MNTVVQTDFDTLYPDIRESGKTSLQQCQLVMLRMLKIFNHLCRKHNIEYFLVGGTLLGAIRHKGFIPWDDDMDIGMQRRDFSRFQKIAAKELPNDIFWQHTDSDPFYPYYHQAEAKLRDKYSRMFRTAKMEEKCRWHNGIQIDIFVYDRAFLPSNHRIWQLNNWFIKKFRRHRNKHIKPVILKMIEMLAPLPLVYASNFIYKQNLVNTGANFITKAELKSLKRVPFEDMEAPVPIGWEACLKRQYGNYMQLPPVSERVGAHSVQPPDAFTPCNHKEILYWHERKKPAAQQNTEQDFNQQKERHPL